MFSIKYRIFENYDHDANNGLSGYFQVICNGKEYGDFFPPELDEIMSDVWISDWFEVMLKLIILLQSNEYISVKDIETNNLWISFHRKQDIVSVSLIHSERASGYPPIFIGNLKEDSFGSWRDQEINYFQFWDEVVAKASQYISEVNEKYTWYMNSETILMLTKLIEELSLLRNQCYPQ